jgi:glycosyltransferase involved in cell wall biosynthesis
MKIILSANTDWYLYNYRLPLAEFLRARGWEAALLSPPGAYTDRLQAAGFRWLAWDLGRRTRAPWRELAAMRQARRIYQAECPDVVHHNTIKPGIYGSLAAARAGVPGIVNSVTGRGYVFLGGAARARAMRPLVHALYRRAFAPDNVRAIFENAADRAYFTRNRLVPQGRTLLIESSGVDAVRFAPAAEPAGIPVVMMASRMLWDKGAGVLVEAARRLGAPSAARVVLVGEPDTGNPHAIPRATLQAWHAEGVVEWWGFRGDMPAVLAQCHIFTLPTMYAEGLPVSLLEAAASRRPIVTTDVPGPADFVEDGVNGLLVPPGDAAALAAALARLIREPDLRGRMGEAGRQRVLAHYTSESINARTLAVYESLPRRK